MESRIAAAGWALRAPEFTEVAQQDHGRPTVVVRFDPDAPPTLLPTWVELRMLWRDLPRHPNLLEVIDWSTTTVWLRYAALDWKLQTVWQVDGDRQVATWGVQLCVLYDAIARAVPPAMLCKFMNPFVHVDLDWHVRVGFRPISGVDGQTHGSLAPEVRARWPQVDQRALVYLVGKLLVDRWPPPRRGSLSPIHMVIACCLEDTPHRRYTTLAELVQALVRAGGSQTVRDGDRLAVWNLIEEGVGWIALHKLANAQARFAEALALDPSSQLAGAGWHAALGRTAIARDPVLTPAVSIPSPAASPGHTELPNGSWADVAPEAAKLEAARGFASALVLYNRVRPDPDTEAARYTAIARCQLELRATALAASAAQHALVLDPDRLEARSILARALLITRQPARALVEVDAWLARGPHDALGHYTRGKVLFALRRLADARASFERARRLRPDLLEAMLLRREVDRAIGGMRQTVGEQPPMLELPAHLAELRGALAAGRIDEVIAGLAAHADPVAQLLLARCLVVENRLDEAVACYDRIDAPEHHREVRIGKATALLELDRPVEALALFELAQRDAPDDLDVADGRARALGKLGRGGEAEPVWTPG